MLFRIEIDVDLVNELDDELSESVAALLRDVADQVENSPNGETCVGELALSCELVPIRMEGIRVGDFGCKF